MTAMTSVTRDDQPILTIAVSSETLLLPAVTDFADSVLAQKISQIAREATELINQGILIESNAPRFYYTAIGDLKIEMLGEAAKDAKERALRIAESTGDSIGSVRSAKMGVMQITAADSTDVSDYVVYDTSTIEKDMTAVVNVSFAIN